MRFPCVSLFLSFNIDFVQSAMNEMGFSGGRYRQGVPKRIIFLKNIKIVCSFGSSVNVGFGKTRLLYLNTCDSARAFCSILGLSCDLFRLSH